MVPTDQDIKTQASPVAWCTYCSKAFWEGGEEQPGRIGVRFPSKRVKHPEDMVYLPICVDCLVSREDIQHWAKVRVSLGFLRRLIASPEPEAEVTVSVSLLRKLKGELSR